MADSRELSSSEYIKERESLLGSAKKEVFELELRDWYWLKNEKDINDSYYSHLSSWKGKVKSTRAHVVSFPLNEYVTYQADYYKKLEDAGEEIYYIDRSKFDRLRQPSGIEICDFLYVDGTVLLTRYLPNQNLMKSEIENGLLVKDKDTVAKYAALKDTIIKSATPMDRFLESAGMVKPKISAHTCPKCGNEDAFVLFYGVIRGDEAPLIIYKCTKCGHVDREW